MGAVVVLVAPVIAAASIEDLQHLADKIRMQRGEISGIEPGISHGYDLASAVEAVVVMGGIHIQAVGGAGDIIQQARGGAVLDPLHIGAGGQSRDLTRRHDRADQAPAFAGCGADFAGLRGAQDGRNRERIIGRKGLDSDRQRDGGRFFQEGGEQGLQFVGRPVFPMPSHVRHVGQPADGGRGRFDQQRVMWQIGAHGGAGILQGLPPFRLQRAIEQHQPRITTRGRCMVRLLIQRAGKEVTRPQPDHWAVAQRGRGGRAGLRARLLDGGMGLLIGFDRRWPRRGPRQIQARVAPPERGQKHQPRSDQQLPAG
ncbi:MAG: hypothetical protein BWX54_00733 [Verrucomicrobia bacterium ADurb.Bin018]|nr:MAG: hypothetical protein BWX54_00733 [Verrucomicrobia bacterium ADurb.Bin018]